MHIPDDPSYYEKFYFTPAISALELENRAWISRRLGCWDQWYPEAARLTALRGAEILFYPTAIGGHPRHEENTVLLNFPPGRLMQRSHAIANGVLWQWQNRVGHEAPAGADGIEVWGQSFICAPSGEIRETSVRIAKKSFRPKWEWKRVDQHRTSLAILRDRRVDAYEKRHSATAID